MVAFTIQAKAQFDRVSIEPSIGGNLIADQFADLRKNVGNIGIVGRYNFNRTFGLGLYTSLAELHFTDYSSTTYLQASIQGVVDVFDVLDMENDTFTLLGHGGFGVSDTSYETMGVSVAGLTGEFKLYDDFAIKLDFSTFGNWEQQTTLDGQKFNTNAGINSMVYQFSLGVNFYIGKHNIHADWYEEPIAVEREINNYFTERVKDTIVNNYITNSCECEKYEFVFFKHDKSSIEQSELNAITQIYNYLSKHSGSTVSIEGYASATKSSDDYNLALSQRRVDAVKLKLITMGVSSSRIITDAYGKDFKWKDESIHDVSRRVSMFVIKSE